MNAAEHLKAASGLIDELSSDQLESFAGSKQVAALVALTHATMATAIQLGVPVEQVRTGAPMVCMTCGYSESAHTADSGPQGTGCQNNGPWAAADSPAGRAASQGTPA